MFNPIFINSYNKAANHGLATTLNIITIKLPSPSLSFQNAIIMSQIGWKELKICNLIFPFSIVVLCPVEFATQAHRIPFVSA